MATFIEDYLELTREHESPEMFHLWVCIQILSASLGRRVVVKRGFYTVHPCQYIFLVAGSSSCKKSAAMDVGIEVFNEADLTEKSVFIQDQITPQDLIKEMSLRAKEDFLLGVGVDGKTAKEAASLIIPRSVFWYADEADSVINPITKQNGILGLLNTIYGYRDRYEYRTKTSGDHIMTKPCLNLLAGTTPEWLKENLKLSEMNQGFLARVSWVFQKRGRGRINKDSLTLREMELKESLISRLHGYQYLEGEAIFSDEAQDYWNEWYVNLPTEHADSRLDGPLNRQHVLVLKIALVVAVSAESFPTIKKGHLEFAVAITEDLLVGIPSMLVGVSSSDKMGAIDEVWNRIKFSTKRTRIGQRTITRSELLNRLQHRLDAEDLDKAVQTLIQRGLIEENIGGVAGRTTSYVVIKQKEETDNGKEKTQGKEEWSDEGPKTSRIGTNVGEEYPNDPTGVEILHVDDLPPVREGNP